MNVLWLCSWYPNPKDPYDGDFIQRHARALAQYMPVTVMYVAQWGESVQVEKEKVVEQFDEGVRERIIFFKFRKTGFKWLDKFLYNLRYHKTYKQEIRKYIYENGKPGLVHVHIPVKAGRLVGWIKRKWGIPYIVSEHSSLYDASAPGNFFTRNFLHRRYVQKIYSDAVAVTNVSKAVGDLLEKVFALKNIRVIHNTVNTDFFHFNEFTPAPFRFIHVSTMNHQKNVEGILRTTARLARQRKDFEVVLVGPVNNTIINEIVKHGLQSVVTCTGEIAYPEVAQQMQRSSALVLFSRHENFPCVIPEALCCGLPCIAADVGGVAEAIHETNGILVQKENGDELLTAMKSMMEHYTQYNRQEISAAAIEKYSYPVIGKQFSDLYMEIIQSPQTQS
jgi:glycosyltransferase involved in cell wall biosynthesis